MRDGLLSAPVAVQAKILLKVIIVALRTLFGWVS